MTREELARIIDPGAFCDIGARPNPITDDRQRSALSKADQVLARLAAKPADEGVRETTIEECAVIAGSYATVSSRCAKLAAAAIRSLSTTGQPKP